MLSHKTLDTDSTGTNETSQGSSESFTEADLVVQVWHQAAQVSTDCECADVDESQPDAKAGQQGVCD